LSRNEANSNIKSFGGSIGTSYTSKKGFILILHNTSRLDAGDLAQVRHYRRSV
jgi:hypothetical protein